MFCDFIIGEKLFKVITAGFHFQKMSVYPITQDYLMLIIETYIKDRIDSNWITVLDDVYENLREKAYEMEVIITNQPIDIELYLAEYENFKSLIDGFYQPNRMTVQKFYNLMAYAGLVGKKLAASINNMTLLIRTLERYIVEMNLVAWFRSNIHCFDYSTININ